KRNSAKAEGKEACAESCPRQAGMTHNLKGGATRAFPLVYLSSSDCVPCEAKESEMKIGVLFWILMLVWLLFGLWSAWPAGSAVGFAYGPVGGDILLFLVLRIL